MADEHEEKLKQFIDDYIQKSLGKFIGAKPNREEIERVINKFLEGLSANTRVVPESVPEVLVDGDTIHIKGKLHFPNVATFKGPFIPWRDSDGLVHIIGQLGTYHVRACDYHQIKTGDYGQRDLVVSCLACLTLNIVTAT